MKKLYIFLSTLLVAYQLNASDSIDLPNINVKEKVLDNGFKIMVVEKPGTARVACRLIYEVGSIDEKPGKTGLAHFFEHMMFKGTNQIGVEPGMQEVDKNYRRQLDEVGLAIWEQEDSPEPDTIKLKELKAKLANLYQQQRKNSLIKDEVWNIYRRVGGTGMNAFTSEDLTCYLIELPAEAVELFFWVETDRMHHLEMREFYSEREVVRGERRSRLESQPKNIALTDMNRIFYGGSPYSWPVIGWSEDIDRVTREEARDFFDDHYYPGNATLILVGGIKAEEMFQLAEKYFGVSTKKPKVKTYRRRNFQPLHGRVMYEVQTPTDTEVILWYPSVDADHPDALAGDLLASVLNGKEGLLYQKLVKEEKLCRKISCYHQSKLLAGRFAIHATPRQGVSRGQVLGAIENVVRSLKEHAFDNERLESVKLKDNVTLFKRLKNDGQLAVMLGFAEVYGGWYRILEDLKKSQQITTKDLNEFAAKILDPKKVFVGMIQDSRELEQN